MENVKITVFLLGSYCIIYYIYIIVEPLINN